MVQYSQDTHIHAFILLYTCVWLWMSGLSWTSELFKYSFMRIKSCYKATYMKMIGMRLIDMYSGWEMDRNKDIAIWHKDGTWINETFNHFKLNLIVYGIDILDQFYWQPTLFSYPRNLSKVKRVFHKTIIIKREKASIFIQKKVCHILCMLYYHQYNDICGLLLQCIIFLFTLHVFDKKKWAD